MENKISKLLVSTTFIKRLLSAIVIIPLMIFPVLWGTYSLIIIYLMLLSFVVDEMFHIIKNSKYKIITNTYLIITIFSFTFFILILLSSHVRNLFALIIITIWLFDTFSYLGGSNFKGKKIFPKISKGKTYSGLFTGLIAVNIIYFLGFYYFDSIQFIPYYSIIIIITLSFIGDAIVSLLKRSASLKDSSNLIPGHGGFLDRLDSFILTFFFVEIYFLWA